MKKLVLLGGGYGNMRVLSRLLPNNLPEDISITLIDRVTLSLFKNRILRIGCRYHFGSGCAFIFSRASSVGNQIRRGNED